MGKAALLLLAAALVAGCTIIDRSDPARSLPGRDGRRVAHINTTRYALHFALRLPFLGDASLERTHDRLTEEARKMGAKNVEIVQSNVKSYWYVLFPLSLLFTPVQTEIAANVDLPEDGAQAPQ